MKELQEMKNKLKKLERLKENEIVEILRLEKQQKLDESLKISEEVEERSMRIWMYGNYIKRLKNDIERISTIVGLLKES